MHPRIRLPLWLAALLPLAAYAYRSIVLRGGDWSPDLPWDLVALIALAVMIALVAWARAKAVSKPSEAPGDESPHSGTVE